jgi:S1-C subfamily serine protease
MRNEGKPASVIRICLLSVFTLGACAHGRLEVAGLTGNWFATERVEVFDSHGSGVVIHENGYILTAAHVVDGEKKIEFAYEDDAGSETRYPAAVVAIDREYDLAVIKVEHRFEHVVTLDDPANLNPGDSVYNLGYPYMCAKTVVRGHIMSLRVNISIPAEKTRVPNAVIVDMLIAPGDSGGGLFSESDGRLVGLMIGIIELRNRHETPMPLRIAVSVEDIRGFLDLNHVPYRD